MTAGLIPLPLLTTPAHGAETGPSGGTGAASTAVTAPTSFGKDAATIPEERPAAEASHEADQDVLSYWTHERMAAAKPLDADAADDPAQERPAAADDGDSSSSTDPAGTTEPVAPAADGGTALPARTKGKLFFNGYKADNVYCSASVLNTPSRSVIITAAHCVYSAQEGWAKDAVFVPDYDRTQADPDPVGVWTARSMRTFDSWRADQTDYRNDVAYVTLNDGGDANKPIVDVVGGHGLAWGGGYVFHATIFGYPNNKTNPDGRGTIHSCVRTTEESEGKVRTEGCDFGFGASGGPWLYRYDDATGLGYVRSLTSLWRPLGGVNRGPYFTEAVKTMLDATAGD
ncbi:hypothetical protein [Actinomyces sp. ZJ308]|uniref:trypsin-like serine peptidase n=1 Tax=Actinomyces sp. ZJ308 TaxID=2708342 RepID=UPI001FBA827C|nr:hypothetical protein [Actinomyces sp. ZJ308]